MRFAKTSVTLLSASFLLAPLAGCESLPGNEKQQGAVIGGAGGAAAGAAIGGKDHRLGGAVIGGLLGAGGGYLVGAKMDKDKDKDKDNAERRDEAVQAAEKAKANPATADDVKNSNTADLNDDGFVTLDEVAAMEKAGLSDKEQIRRLERTQQYFQLTKEQQDYLRRQGVSDEVVTAMRDMKPDEARVASDKVEPTKNEKDVDLRTTPR
jgi:uncharacterized membrane protein YebE (DUF533 family)